MFHDFSRRALLGAGGALLLPAGFARAQEGRVVGTTEGRYRGLLINGVHVFKGMRYGASTAGARRFLPPQPPEKFAGVRDAFDYGDQTPQQRGGLADAVRRAAQAGQRPLPDRAGLLRTLPARSHNVVGLGAGTGVASAA